MNKLTFVDKNFQDEQQFIGLQQTLTYINKHSAFYQRLFQEKNVNIETIQCLKDIELLPFTEKEDIQLFSNDFVCVPKKDIAEYCATSGTLGNPVFVALTKSDVTRLSENERFSFENMQISNLDTVQLMLTLDKMFMAGMAYYLGLEHAEASVLRTGAGLPAYQIEMAQKLETTVWVAVPSFLLKIKEYCKAQQIDLNTLKVKKILCIGENIRDENWNKNVLANKILEDWDVQLFSTYASTEMQTAFTECIYGKGVHQQSDKIILEIIDEDGNALEENKIGEVCITTIGVEGMPLLRYKTGDMAFYTSEKCLCGSMSKRLSPIVARKKQMIKYKGTTIYPNSIIEALNNTNLIQEFVIEVQKNDIENDELILHIFTHQNEKECEEKLIPLLQSKLRIKPVFKFVDEQNIFTMQFPNGNRKPIKFLDNR